METHGSEAELALEKIDSAFNAFTSFYGRLIEKGINETKYGKVFADVPKDDKQMAMEDVKKIETYMRLAEKKGPFDQINEYVGAGEKKVEEIVRNCADRTAPVGTSTLSLGMFGVLGGLIFDNRN